MEEEKDDSKIVNTLCAVLNKIKENYQENQVEGEEFEIFKSQKR